MAQTVFLPAVIGLILLASAPLGQAGDDSTCTPAEPREDCGYLGINQEECEKKQCCWAPTDNDGTPWCALPETTCTPGEPRIDCGYLGITQKECEEKKCCWAPVLSEGTPWCVYPPNSCLPDEPREDCGYLGITEEECLEKDCCWDETEPDDGKPWCYFPQTKGSTDAKDE